MKPSTQVAGALVTLAVLLAPRLLPMDSTLRALTAALIITVGGGTMAFLRSRSTPPNQMANRRG
jgi:hypothetical protein